MNKRKIIILVLVLASAVVSGYSAVVFGGFVNISATGKHLPFVEWTLKTTMRNAVRRAAKDLKAPNLDGEETLRRGAKHYDEMCASCHAAPGKAADELVDGLIPKPPEIAKIVADRTPEELFWVTKYGIKMTGMPAWGPSHEDTDIWAMVAFMRIMPKTTPENYEVLLGGDHDMGEMPEDMTMPSAAAPHEHEHHH